MGDTFVRLVKAIPALIAVITLPTGLFTGLFFGFTPAAIVFILGWFFLLPVSSILIEQVLDLERLVDDAPAERDDRDPLDTLRDRYARGEISEETFERKLEELLATETVEDVDRYLGQEDERTETANERTR